jgi:hypothetical protein
MRFDHEQLDVYRFAIEFLPWAGGRRSLIGQP